MVPLERSAFHGILTELARCRQRATSKELERGVQIPHSDLTIDYRSLLLVIFLSSPKINRYWKISATVSLLKTSGVGVAVMDGKHHGVGFQTDTLSPNLVLHTMVTFPKAIR